MAAITSAEQFLYAMCVQLNMSREEVLEDYVVLPCECGATCCQGYALVPNDTASVVDHLETGGRV